MLAWRMRFMDFTTLLCMTVHGIRTVLADITCADCSR